ncbi:MAG: hypothetical protein ACR2FJ_04845 [Qipengyuania sp.]
MASKPIRPVPVGSRLRQIGWAIVLAVCLALFLALTFKVNAVKSEVRLAERKIVALQKEKLMLEVEFQTRASQRQLAAWNAVEFGYESPRAHQYLETERQLAMLGTGRAIDAPAPIRVARAEPVEDEGLFSGWDASLVAEAQAQDLDSAGGVRAERSTPMAATSLAAHLARNSTAASLAAEAPQ